MKRYATTVCIVAHFDRLQLLLAYGDAGTNHKCNETVKSLRLLAMFPLRHWVSCCEY